MKNLIGVFLFCFLFVYCHAQSYWPDEFSVMVSKLNMRETPSVNSRILTTLEWGDIVYPATIDSLETQTCDTINNLSGCWWKVQHHNHTGYVFSPYLRQPYMLAYEDSYLGEIPKYRFWYGVYYDETKGAEYIKKIKPSLVEEENTTDDHRHTLLKTDQTAKSLFIIATFDSIPEKEMGLFTRNDRIGRKCSGTLDPGDIDYLYSSSAESRITSESYVMYTTGTYIYKGNDILRTNIDIVIVGTTQYSKQKVVQNMKQYFGNKEAYSLEYFGDIDGDDRPDLIMSGSSTSSGGTILFLSSRAKEGELLSPVAGFEALDEC